jgi:hydrogenase maturation protease
MNILVLGIGQSLRRDDSAGLEVVRIWQAQYPLTAEKVKVETTELPGLALLDSLFLVDAAILVDAVQSSAPLGTVICLGTHELSSFTNNSAPSHGWGVAETLHLGISLYPSLAKSQITLLGIVARDFGMGEGLSLEVHAAIPKVVEMVESEIQKFMK